MSRRIRRIRHSSRASMARFLTPGFSILSQGNISHSLGKHLESSDRFDFKHIMGWQKIHDQNEATECLFDW